MTKPSSPPDNQPTDDDEISLLDLLIVLAKHKQLILGLPFVVAVITAGYSLLMPDIFTATTKILPPQQNQSASSAMLAQLGGLAGLVGGVGRSPTDVYVAMLKSRTIADNLVQRFDLMKSSKAKYRSWVRDELASVTRISSEKDGIITIEVDDKDPRRAAELANAFVDELLKLTQVLALTDAAQRRLFFERQLAQARDNLTKAEADALHAMDKGGLVQVEGQGRAIIENTARLRGQITVKEVQIGAMRTFATDSNPDLKLVQQELESLRRELARIEGTSGNTSGKGRENDGSGIDSVGLLRNVKYRETIYELLAKQFELAKIDESKDSAVVQVMDKAIEPDFKSKPKRTLFVLLWAFVAGIVAILSAFAREALAKARTDPQQAARLEAVKRHLAWHRTA